MTEVWVFNGQGARFPSAIFSNREAAEKWIAQYHLSGVLTEYPVDISVYDWAIQTGNFKVKTDKDRTQEFIQKFSSGAQRHLHFENGVDE